MSYQLRNLSLYSDSLTLGGVNPMSEALGSGAILTGVIWGAPILFVVKNGDSFHQPLMGPEISGGAMLHRTVVPHGDGPWCPSEATGDLRTAQSLQ